MVTRLSGRTLSVVLVSVAALIVGFLLWNASPVGAAPPDHAQVSEHARVVAYWTPERVARAVPRELRVIVAPQAKPSSPGKGGGGGDGGGGALPSVTGASWTSGGLVKATTGKVLFTLGGVNYVCSGTVVTDSRADASLVLTAGHCVYDDVSDAWATNWMFVPDYEDGRTFSCDATRYGCWTATALVTTSAWATGDFNDDYAFAVMGPGGRTGEALLLEGVVGSQGIAFNVAHPTHVYAFGYPHAAPYDGQVLSYCAGTDVADGWGYSSAFGLECDMTGGSSGGGWYVNFDGAVGAGQLNSLNSFKYVRGRWSKYMFGPYFDGYTQATYASAQTAVQHTLVSAP